MSMRWQDERYVRLYVRDTAEDVALGWEARALWHELLKKFDRAGILELGKTGLRGVAGLTGVPLEVVERALPLLIEDGRAVMRGTRLVYPDYIAANETPASPALRNREWRARQRALAAQEALIETGRLIDEVMNADVETFRHPNETRRDDGETPRDIARPRADPIRTDPDPPSSAGAREAPVDPVPPEPVTGSPPFPTDAGVLPALGLPPDPVVATPQAPVLRLVSAPPPEPASSQAEAAATPPRPSGDDLLTFLGEQAAEGHPWCSKVHAELGKGGRLTPGQRDALRKIRAEQAEKASRTGTSPRAGPRKGPIVMGQPPAPEGHRSWKNKLPATRTP